MATPKKRTTKKGGKSKTTFPMTKAAFLANAKPISVKLGESTVLVQPREFSTGSVGLYAGEKVVLDIGGTPVKFQVGITLTAVGSKDAEEGTEEDAEKSAA